MQLCLHRRGPSPGRWQALEFEGVLLFHDFVFEARLRTWGFDSGGVVSASTALAISKAPAVRRTHETASKTTPW